MQSEGHIEAVRFLCEKGANLSAADRWQCTPLDDGSHGLATPHSIRFHLLAFSFSQRFVMIAVLWSNICAALAECILEISRRNCCK